MRVDLREPLKFPLQTAPLLVVIVFSALLWLAIKAGLLGIWLGILLLAGIFNYGFVLLERASIKAESPPLAIELMNPVSSGRTIVLLAICGCAVVGYYAALSVSVWLATVVCLLACAAIPGMIAAQGLSGSAFQALNVHGIVRLLLEMRADYAQLVLVFVLSTGACALALRFQVPLIAWIALMIYCWLLIFSAVGCAVREYRDDLGLANAFAEEEVVEQTDARNRDRARAQLLDRIYAQWRGGSHRNALETVAVELASSSDPLSELQWLYQQASQWPDKRLAEQLALPLIHRLLNAARNGDALDIARAHIKLNSKFRPEQGEDAIRLARLARDAGDRPTARVLLADFADVYPRDPAHTTAALLYRQLER
jgi:hypothetical protein